MGVYWVMGVDMQAFETLTKLTGCPSVSAGETATLVKSHTGLLLTSGSLRI